MTKLEVSGAAKLHDIPFTDIDKKRKQDTLGILQTDLKLPNGEVLTTFAVLFPAPFHPLKYRKQALKFLNTLKSKLPKGRKVIAAGDFNIPLEEEKTSKILEELAFSSWNVSHHIGCKGCKGTNYYPPKKSWSFLDMIFMSKNLSNEASGWQVSIDSIRIANQAPEQMDNRGFPKSYEVDGKQGSAKVTGVSDHWPVVVDLYLKK